MVHLDDFWDLSLFFPQKKQPKEEPKKKEENRIDLPDVFVEKNEEKPTNSTPVFHFGEQRDPNIEVSEYSFQENALLYSVKIEKKLPYLQNSRNAFLHSSAKLHETPLNGTPAFTPFFSLYPGFQQMTPQQKEYYLYYFESMKKGEIVKSDIGYENLLLCDIIASTDNIDKNTGIQILLNFAFSIAKDQKEKFKRMEEMIFYYSLIFQVDLSAYADEHQLLRLAEVSSTPEFYFQILPISSKKCFDFVFPCFSDYLWKYSKIRTKENEKVMDEVFYTILSSLLKTLLSKPEEVPPDLLSKCEGYAFSHCNPSIRYQYMVSLSYLSRKNALAIRKAMTMATKYLENLFRADMSLRSRLAVSDLPETLASSIKSLYLSHTNKQKIPKLEKEPEYMEQYAPKTKEISFDEVSSIEKASWETTKALSTEFDEDIVVEEVEPIFDTPEETNEKTLSKEAKAYLTELCGMAQKQNRNALTEDTLAEEINLLFSDLLSDVVLSYDGQHYTLLDDYINEVQTWLMKN